MLVPDQRNLDKSIAQAAETIRMKAKWKRMGEVNVSFLP